MKLHFWLDARRLNDLSQIVFFGCVLYHFITELFHYKIITNWLTFYEAGTKVNKQLHQLLMDIINTINISCSQHRIDEFCSPRSHSSHSFSTLISGLLHQSWFEVWALFLPSKSVKWIYRGVKYFLRRNKLEF